MKRAVIVGATGFGGLGLLELLYRHPEIEVTELYARKDIGKKISDVFPHLAGKYDMAVQEMNYDVDADIIFLSTPDRAGMDIVKPFVERNIPVIDYSGDFRFKTQQHYKNYAVNKSIDTEHSAADLLKDSVYGLPEKFRNEIKNAKIVGNPGCFAICMILGLLPAIENNIISADDCIVVDGKSGVSGAGKNPGEANFYPQRYENINTYREGSHQHLVEVENLINSSGANRKIFFVPQVIPMTRGILNNIYFTPAVSITQKILSEMFCDYYKDEPFVRVSAKSPNTTDVRFTNNCLLRPYYDERTGRVLITSVIDNLLKGQSGNAVQNANIMLGFPETMALDFPGFYP